MSFLTRDPRVLRPGRFFLQMDIATALFVLWAVLFVSSNGDDVRVLIQLAWTLMLFVLFFRRGQDEFWNACWRRATSAAFLALVVTPVTSGFIEGLMDGFMDRPAVRSAEPPFDAIVTVLFAAFFATFHWTRFRGGAR